MCLCLLKEINVLEASIKRFSLWIACCVTHVVFALVISSRGDAYRAKPIEL